MERERDSFSSLFLSLFLPSFFLPASLPPSQSKQGCAVSKHRPAKSAGDGMCVRGRATYMCACVSAYFPVSLCVSLCILYVCMHVCACPNAYIHVYAQRGIVFILHMYNSLTRTDRYRRRSSKTPSTRTATTKTNAPPSPKPHPPTHNHN